MNEKTIQRWPDLPCWVVDLRSHLALDRWTDKMVAWVDDHLLVATSKCTDRQMEF